MTKTEIRKMNKDALDAAATELGVTFPTEVNTNEEKKDFLCNHLDSKPTETPAEGKEEKPEEKPAEESKESPSEQPAGESVTPVEPKAEETPDFVPLADLKPKPDHPKSLEDATQRVRNLLTAIEDQKVVAPSEEIKARYDDKLATVREVCELLGIEL